jgi:uncharacterized protein YaaN involved in tellurite resistance
MSGTVKQPDPAQSAGSGTFSAVDPIEAERLDRTVAEYVETLASLEPGRPRFLRAVAAISRLGQREFTAATAMSSRMAERRLHEERSLLAARAPLAERLAELRRIVDELDPGQIEVGSGKGRGLFGRGKPDRLAELARYFERFWHSQAHVEEILAVLSQGRLELDREGALLANEEVSLATIITTLNEHAYLAANLDAALTQRIDAIARTDPTRADCMREDLLYAVRRRRLEILTQIAVASQGYASLQIVREANEDLATAIAGATTTTAAALRTAMMVAQAVAGQRLAEERAEDAKEAAAEMVDDARGFADRHARAVRGRATATTDARLVSLRGAWAEASEALTRLDAQKEQALQTVASADRGNEPIGREPGP